MKRKVLAVMVAVLALSGVHAWAQATESFLGSVKAVSGNSVTVERGTLTGVFSFDSKTHVSVAGATAKTKKTRRPARVASRCRTSFTSAIR